MDHHLETLLGWTERGRERKLIIGLTLDHHLETLLGWTERGRERKKANNRANVGSTPRNIAGMERERERERERKLITELTLDHHLETLLGWTERGRGRKKANNRANVGSTPRNIAGMDRKKERERKKANNRANVGSTPRNIAGMDRKRERKKES